MKKVFLIDDDEDDQLLFQDALLTVNPCWEMETASNGKIALDQLRNQPTPPNLIFLDLNMPVMNGFEFLMNLKDEPNLRNIPLGIFTTSNMIRDIEGTKAFGVKFFLTKPKDFNSLCQRLQEVLATDFTQLDFYNFK